MGRAVPADFTEFMQARWSALFRTAYLLTGNRHDAEELLQEAMARTCVSWSRIRDKGALDAYVRRILVHDTGTSTLHTLYSTSPETLTCAYHYEDETGTLSLPTS